MDTATTWLVDQGRTGQWGDGTALHSTNPTRIKQATELIESGGGWIAVGLVPPPPLPSVSGEGLSVTEGAAAEAEGQVIGAVVVQDSPVPYVAPAGEPERYVRLLITHRAWKGRGLGDLLMNKAREITKAAGVGLLRVDCYAGGDKKLVKWYESQGFTQTESFMAGGTWPGQVLEIRI
ncbi:Sortase and related acyltransferase [Thozetella sp. PMI_491]|nr:Sortase and related acyltransferase [Thozetella sp. PMI_491]